MRKAARSHSCCLYKSRATGADIKATEDGVEYHQPPSPVVFVPSGFKGLMKSVFVEGVRQVLYEMLYNIADNAVRYTNKDGIVKIFVGQRGSHPYYRVEDNGIGIPKEEQKRIFERFYRVDKSHSRETGGTGLGLSIVKHGAILHNAEIVLDSEPGQGTKMELVF